MYIFYSIQLITGVKMKKEIKVEKNDEGYRVEGILNGRTIIAASNRFLKSEWHITQSSGLVGEFDESLCVLALMKEVVEKVKELKKEA